MAHLKCVAHGRRSIIIDPPEDPQRPIGRIVHRSTIHDGGRGAACGEEAQGLVYAGRHVPATTDWKNWDQALRDGQDVSTPKPRRKRRHRGRRGRRQKEDTL